MPIIITQLYLYFNKFFYRFIKKIYKDDCPNLDLRITTTYV